MNNVYSANDIITFVGNWYLSYGYGDRQTAIDETVAYLKRRAGEPGAVYGWSTFVEENIAMAWFISPIVNPAMTDPTMPMPGSPIHKMLEDAGRLLSGPSTYNIKY